MTQISEHITLEQATYSATAIRKNITNTPSQFEIDAMRIVADKCFEPIYNHFKAELGIEIAVSSFYRSTLTNEAVGGQRTSQHVRGEAIDIIANKGNSDRAMNKKIYEWCKANLNFDQLINEFPDANGNPSWVHISFVSKEKNRKQYFTIK